MKNIFEKHMKNTNIIFVNNNWNINNLPVSPQKCFEIYNNSIFVICGRGNHSLDCFRIYEAIVAGSIPVIMGTLDEINVTFNYNDNIPPFIYDNNWERIVVRCNLLLKDFDKLQKMQDMLLKWWSNETSVIRKLIADQIR